MEIVISFSKISEYRNQVKEHAIEKNSYISAFNLDTRKGIYTKELLQEVLNCSCLPEELQDLTQLSEEILGQLYSLCGKKLKQSQGGNCSHLKRLRGAIRYYFKLVLKKELEIPEAKELKISHEQMVKLPQEGDFCFTNLFQVWLRAAGKTRGEKLILKTLLGFCPDKKAVVQLSVLQDRKQTLFQSDSWLSIDDAKILRESLYAAVKEAAKWDEESRKRYFHCFGANSDTLSCILKQLEKPVPQNLEREYACLNNLSKYWNILYPTKSKGVSRGKIFFVQLLFLFLAATLNSDSPCCFSVPPVKEDIMSKLSSALGCAGAPLIPSLAQEFVKEKLDENIIFARVPINGWTWNDRDVNYARQSPIICEQLIELFRETGRNVFRQTWTENSTPQNYERIQAIQALLRLALDMVGGHTAFLQDSDERRKIDEVLFQLLTCYRDPELRIYLINLQNPGWTRLELLAAQPGMQRLSQTMEPVNDVSEDYVRVLRLAQDLDNLEPTAKIELSRLADDAERRLQLYQEGINAATDVDIFRKTVCSVQNRIFSHEKEFCPIWNEEHNYDYMRPYISNAFDSVYNFGATETQLQLASIILRSGRVVLTMPQIIDNPNLLKLVFNAPFLELLGCGCVTVSFFKSYFSLQEYALEALKSDRFCFSGYHIFEGNEEVEKKYLRACMISYLNAKDESERVAALSKAPYAFWQSLSQYGDAIRLADEALRQQFCNGTFSTLPRLFHQSTGWRSNFRRRGVLARVGDYLNNLSDHEELAALHQVIVNTVSADATRSHIYKALEDISQPGVSDYRTIVDWMYFEESSTCISPFKEFWIGQKDQHLLPKNQRGKELFFHVSYTQTVQNDSGSLLKLSDLVRFVRESREWVIKHSSQASASSILRGVLANDQSVQIEDISDYRICCLKHLKLWVEDGTERKPVLQEKCEQGIFTQLEHWA